MMIHIISIRKNIAIIITCILLLLINRSGVNLDEFVGETGYDGFGCFAETVDVDEVVLSERVEQGEDDLFGDLLADARHGARSVDQNDHVFGAGRRLQVPRTQPAVEQVRVRFPLIPHRCYHHIINQN